jgi:hypothetical protein
MKNIKKVFSSLEQEKIFSLFKAKKINSNTGSERRKKNGKELYFIISPIFILF